MYTCIYYFSLIKFELLQYIACYQKEILKMNEINIYIIYDKLSLLSKLIIFSILKENVFFYHSYFKYITTLYINIYIYIYNNWNYKIIYKKFS